MASSKKRIYLDSYLNFGFTSVNERGVVKSQCVIFVAGVEASFLSPWK